MKMKYFKDSHNNVYGLLVDGSQDFLKKSDWVPIQDKAVQPLVDAKQQADFEANDYYRKRLYSYPELGEFVDAYVKGDENAMEEYKQKCLAVKAKYPKPPGF